MKVSVRVFFTKKQFLIDRVEKFVAFSPIYLTVMRTSMKREEIYCTSQANVKVKFNNYWQTMRNITREWCHQIQEGDVALETRPFWQGIYNRTKMQPLLKRNAPLPHVYYLKIGETRSIMFLVLLPSLTILRNVTIFKTVIHLSLQWAVLFRKIKHFGFVRRIQRW